MRLVIALSTILLPAAALAAQPAAKRLAPVPVKQCQKADIVHAKMWAKPEMKKLGELPSGDLRLGVHRQIGGCLEPVVVRHNIGG